MAVGLVTVDLTTVGLMEIGLMRHPMLVYSDSDVFLLKRYKSKWVRPCIK